MGFTLDNPQRTKKRKFNRSKKIPLLIPHTADAYARNDVLATKRKTLESKILQLHATILSDVSSLVAVVVVVIVACKEVVLLGRHAVELQLRIAVVRRDGREVAVGSLDEAASTLFSAVCFESKQIELKFRSFRVNVVPPYSLESFQ